MMPIEFIGPALRLVFLLDKRINEVLKGAFGIGLSSFKILFLLRFNAQLNQAGIAKSWGTTEAAISRQIQILLDQKLIERSLRKTGRSNNFRLSREGKKLTKSADLVIDTELNKVFKNMTTTDRKKFAASIVLALRCMKDAGLADDPFLAQKHISIQKKTA